MVGLTFNTQRILEMERIEHPSERGQFDIAVDLLSSAQAEVPRATRCIITMGLLFFLGVYSYTV